MLSMTTSIGGAFGSCLMVRGFLLNNNLTDLAFLPSKKEKKAVNRVEPNKRPMSSMAPTLKSRDKFYSGGSGSVKSSGTKSNSSDLRLNHREDREASEENAKFCEI